MISKMATLAKFSEQEVRAIRKAVKGGALLREVASMFGASMSTISRIVKRESYKGVK
jgi:transposase